MTAPLLPGMPQPIADKVWKTIEKIYHLKFTKKLSWWGSKVYRELIMENEHYIINKNKENKRWMLDLQVFISPKETKSKPTKLL